MAVVQTTLKIGKKDVTLITGKRPQNAIAKVMFGQVWATNSPVDGVETVDLSDVAKELQAVSDLLKKRFVDRDDLIDMSVLALASGEPAFVESLPGESKTTILKLLSKMTNGKFWGRALNQATHEDDLVGAIDPIAYRDGKGWQRKFEHLATCEIGLLDEIWKATSASDTILDVLAERVVGGKQIPLLTCFSASNEIPTDKHSMAAWDRWTLRTQVKPISNGDDFSSLLKATADTILTAPTNLSPDKIRLMAGAAELMSLNLPEQVADTIKNLWSTLMAEGKIISSRRWRKLSKVACAQALIDNEPVNATHLSVARWMLWTELDERETIEKMVLSMTDPYGSEILGLEALLESLQSAIAPDNLTNLSTDELAELIINARSLSKECKTAISKMPKKYHIKLNGISSDASTIDQLVQKTMFGAGAN